MNGPGHGSMGATAEPPREPSESRQAAGSGGSSGPRVSKDGNPRPSKWEWVTAAVGALLVLGAIGFMLYEAVVRSGTPPDLRVRVESVAPVGGVYRVMLRVDNRGGTTAASLQLEGTLKADTATVETSDVTIDYVPAGGHREAGLIFTEDPRRHTLEVRPKGFELP